jgi:hypothetical protein
MSDLLEQEITGLLEKAQSAHHVFEKEELEGEFDEQWPAWYADYLLNNGLAELFATSIDLDTLAEWLQKISQQHKAENTLQSWAAYSANKLLSAFSGSAT